MSKVKQIIVDHGIQSKLAVVFGCTPAYVSLALKGKRTEGDAEKIRYVAIKEYDGYEVDLIAAQRKQQRKAKSTPQRVNIY